MKTFGQLFNPASGHTGRTECKGIRSSLDTLLKNYWPKIARPIGQITVSFWAVSYFERHSIKHQREDSIKLTPMETIQ